MPTADELLGLSVVEDLILCLGGKMPTTSKATESFTGLSLSDRTRLVRDALLTDLPPTFAPFEKKIRTALRKKTFTG